MLGTLKRVRVQSKVSFCAELLHAEDIHHMTAMDYAVMDRGSADVAALLLKVLLPPVSLSPSPSSQKVVCVCERERGVPPQGSTPLLE